MIPIRLPLNFAAFSATGGCLAQQTVTGIPTSNSTRTSVTYTGVKGAGLRITRNTITNLHVGNIERIDLKINALRKPQGLYTGIDLFSLTAIENPI